MCDFMKCLIKFMIFIYCASEHSFAFLHNQEISESATRSAKVTGSCIFQSAESSKCKRKDFSANCVTI